jgi:hypothetical protein
MIFSFAFCPDALPPHRDKPEKSMLYEGGKEIDFSEAATENIIFQPFFSYFSK